MAGSVEKRGVLASEIEVFDKEKFKRLAFEKQRTMLAFVYAGTEIKITRIVHHGWGTNGRYWAIRGNIFLNNEIIFINILM